MPMAVLGTVTDNNTYYDVDSFVYQLNSPTTFFNRLLSDGKLYGEFGHPDLLSLTKEQQIRRLTKIDEKNQSHHISAVMTGEKLENGGRIIYGLVKPAGPYGEFLKQTLDDPCQNTSFSLRSITHDRAVGNITHRVAKMFVTFDYVCGGGYVEAAKRWAPGVESLDITRDRAIVTEASVALESLKDTEINEIFGAKTVTIGKTSRTFLTKDAALRDETGRLHSVYTSILGGSLP